MEGTIMPEIILASQSPRRKEILTWAGYEFTVQVSDVEEIVPEDCPIEKISEYLSGLKAEAVAKNNRDKMVIGADTIVVIDGKVLGKPKTEEQAKEMLRTLSGRTHIVYTGVTVFYGDRKESFTAKTEVLFYPLTEEEIDIYVKTKEPMDKAGAYGIQGYGCKFIREIHGEYFTVMGLPIGELYHVIEKIKNQ